LPFLPTPERPLAFQFPFPCEWLILSSSRELFASVVEEA